MTFTQQQLEAMSDGEINAIATHIYDNLDATWEVDEEVIINNPHSQRNWLHYDVKPFCNNWSDCGNLIDECGISTDYYSENTYDGNDPCAVKWMPYGYVGCTDKNPKRAVTIVYILIK